MTSCLSLKGNSIASFFLCMHVHCVEKLTLRTKLCHFCFEEVKPKTSLYTPRNSCNKEIIREILHRNYKFQDGSGLIAFATFPPNILIKQFISYRMVPFKQEPTINF